MEVPELFFHWQTYNLQRDPIHTFHRDGKRWDSFWAVAIERFRHHVFLLDPLKPQGLSLGPLCIPIKR